MKGIYAYWDNKLSQYVYIGKDSYIDKNERHKHHLSLSTYDDQVINRVLQNNPERYEYRILMEGNYNEKQLNKMERFCIKHLKTYHYDYPERHVFNFTEGGDGSTGYKHTEEAKQKLSESLKDRTLSDEHKMNVSKSRNTSGYFRVSKKKDKKCKQGFRWKYEYMKNGKTKSITRVNFEKLKEEVLAKGLEWRKL